MVGKLVILKVEIDLQLRFRNLLDSIDWSLNCLIYFYDYLINTLSDANFFMFKIKIAKIITDTNLMITWIDVSYY